MRNIKNIEAFKPNIMKMLKVDEPITRQENNMIFCPSEMVQLQTQASSSFFTPKVDTN